MKIRAGFVSNSSSSSFIVAVDKDAGKTKFKLEIEVDFKEYARETISTMKEFIKYLNYNYGENDCDWFGEEKLAKVEKALKDGKVILIGSFTDNGGDEIEYFLCRQGLKGHVDEDEVVIIESEGGY